MRKFAVIGLGRFGMTLARQLAALGAEVIAVDLLEDRVAEARGFATVAVRMDGTDERALREQGVDGVEVAIVGMGENSEATQLATVVLKNRLAVRRVVVKSPGPLQDKILPRIGADEIVSPEKDSGVRLAQRLLSPGLLEVIELSEGHSLVQLEAPRKFHGKTIRDLDVRNQYGVNIVALKKRRPAGTDEEGKEIYEEDLVEIPGPMDVIEPADVLVLVGRDEDISRLTS
jgi:trk system potassium uptake protein TrkA